MAIAANGGSQSQVSALETAKWCQAVMPAGESNLDVLVVFDGPRCRNATSAFCFISRISPAAQSI